MEEFDKSEAATPYKLEQARAKGSIARSPELTGSLVMLAAVAAFSAWGTDAAQSLLQLMRTLWAAPGSLSGNAHGFYTLIIHGVLGCLSALAPFIVLVVLVAIAGNVMQTGPVWTLFPLKPDLSRINPVSGFKRIFSLRSLYELVKSLLKVAVLGTVLYYAARAAVGEFFLLPEKSPADSLRVLLHVIVALGIKLGLALLLLALLDLGYTRFSFARKMRMSRRDIKDEVKNREGDPRIRSRLRGLRVEMLKRAAAHRQVPQADVLIVNPTHLAIALQYRRGEMTAPRVLAKGAGQLARKMRRTAARHGVPVVENRPLARALYFQADIQETIPETLFADVARVIVWVLAMRQARQSVRGAAA